MELRQIDCKDAAGGADRYGLGRERSWDGIADVLRDGYREVAKRIIRVVQQTKVEAEHGRPAAPDSARPGEGLG